MAKHFWKKIGVLRMLSNYNNNVHYSIIVKMVIAIAFVPIEDLSLTIDMLAVKLPDEIILLLD